MRLDRRRWMGWGASLIGGALLASCGPGGTGATMSDRFRSCQTLSGAPDERLDACLASVSAFSLSPATLDLIRATAGPTGKVLVLGDRLDLPVTQVGLADLPEARLALLGRVEADAARRLRDAGVRGVVVHRDLTGALDRDAAVLSRLAQHDFLEFFELQRVGTDALFYTVRDEPMRLPATVGAELLSSLRARLARVVPARQTWRPKGARLIGKMRLQGQVLVVRHATEPDIERALDDLAEKMRRRWDREVETLGLGALANRLGDARIEVEVVFERAEVEPRSKGEIEDLWEMGVDGMMLSPSSPEDERFAYMPGSEAVTHGHKSPQAFFEYALEAHGWAGTRPWEDLSTTLSLIRTAHFLEERPGGRAVAMFRGMPIERSEDLTDEKIRQMLIDGGEWWLRNQLSDDSFVYKYWPEQNRFSDDYNEVRHALGIRDLVDAWRHRPDPRYLVGAERAMNWMLQYEVRDTDPAHATLPSPPAGSMLFRFPLRPERDDVPNQKLGTVAVAMLGWIDRAKATGNRDQDDRIRAMATFVSSMKQPSGKFEPYFVDAKHPYHGQVNDIVPGEAALALGDAAEYFDDRSLVSFFPAFLDYYEPWFRERAARKVSSGRWPAGTYVNADRLELVQFGPWSVMASAQYYQITGDERAARFGLEVADWMIDTYQWDRVRAPFPDYVGGYYKMPGELPAMQTFCYSEGTAAAYGIAAKFAPERKAKYEEATRDAILFLRRMQYDEVDAYFAPRPDLIHGGVKYAMNEGKVRTDYVGHGMSTLSQYLDVRAADPDVRLALPPMDPTVAANGAVVRASGIVDAAGLGGPRRRDEGDNQSGD